MSILAEKLSTPSDVDTSAIGSAIGAVLVLILASLLRTETFGLKPGPEDSRTGSRDVFFKKVARKFIVILIQTYSKKLQKKKVCIRKIGRC